MAWTDRLRQPSFRGIPFEVDDDDGVFGRRTVDHEYPGRDKPYVEDMGRRTREFTLDGYVSGENFDSRRDALISACEQSGSGVLVHPRYGEMLVYSKPLRVRHQKRSGRIAYLSFTFIEAGELQFPSSVVDTVSSARSAAAEAVSVSTSAFEDQWSASSGQGFILRDAVTVIDDMLLRINQTRVAAAKSLDYQSTYRSVASKVVTLAQSAADLAEGLADLVRLPFGSDNSKPAPSFSSSGDGYTNYGLLLENFSLMDSAAAELAIALTLSDANRIALARYTNRAAVAETARIAAMTDYRSSDDGLSALDRLTRAIDDILASADDDTYLVFENLRASIITDITERSAQLPRLVSLTLPASIPGLVLAYDLYEDVSREQELLDRNGVLHPGFVPGGTELEVLSRV